MFGIYRFILSLFVVFQHLGGFDPLGAYAVFGFYILSGYLMTFILVEQYGYGAEGIKKYILNRFLRIYPPYWVSSIVAVLLIALVGDGISSQYHHAMYVPRDIDALTRNTLLLFPHRSEPRLTPPAWALTVEICFYLLMALGVSKTKRNTLIWFVLSAGYAVAVNVLSVPSAIRYFTIPAAALPFSTGALVFHYRHVMLKRFPQALSRTASMIYFSLILMNYLVIYLLNYPNRVSFYFNYLFCTILLLSLTQTKKTYSPVRIKIDRFLGDLSYPVYLLHYQAGLLLVVLGVSIPRGEPLFAMLALPIILLMAWILAVFVERPVEVLRRRIKQNATANR